MSTVQKKLSPTDKRHQAIRETVDQLLVEWKYLRPTTTRQTASQEIAKLDSLGRSDKWKKGVQGWAKMVSNEDDPLSWAIVQGAIFLNMEA